MFNDIVSVRDYLKTHNNSVFDLVAINGLLGELNYPNEGSKVIHITGTNGKGSTGTYLESILTSSGYKVGSFASPAVFDDNEIIKIDGVNISDDDFLYLFNKVMQATHRMELKGIRPPTTFEIETAMAFQYFKENGVDISIMEVGMGGRSDSTNVMHDTMIELITRISYDHMGILGSTLREIAVNKAGIIKKHSTVITTGQTEEVMSVIEKECKELDARLVVAGDGTSISGNSVPKVIAYKGREYATYMLGDYQVYNLPIAIECARELRRMGYKNITDDSIMIGVQNAKLDGRFEIIGDKPLFILDGAHNDEASNMLAESLKSYYADKKIIFILGIFKDKDYKKILDNTMDLASEVITFDWDNPRHLDGKTLEGVARKHISNVKYAGSIENAVAMALEDATRADVIVAFGSLSHLADIKRAYRGVVNNG